MDDDPLFTLMRRFIKHGAMLPSEDEEHDEDALHRAMLLIAEMEKISAEIKSGKHYDWRPSDKLQDVAGGSS
jgi:hypothetical protein